MEDKYSSNMDLTVSVYPDVKSLASCRMEPNEFGTYAACLNAKINT